MKKLIILSILCFATISIFAQNNCPLNVAPGHNGFEPPFNDLNWQLWDGGDSSAAMFVETFSPHTGTQSIRVAISVANNQTDFHHRGTTFPINQNDQYTLHWWMKSNQLDSVKVLSRVVRDTDWTSQTTVDAFVTDTVWTEYSHTFVGSEDWFNAFLEFKISAYNATSDYEVWFDDIWLCFDSTVTTNTNSLLSANSFDAVLQPNIVQNSNTSLYFNNVEQSEKIRLQIVNTVGQVVYNQTINLTVANNFIEVPTYHLPKGLYFIHVQSKNRKQVLRLVVN